jgi:hypothetical protein
MCFSSRGYLFEIPQDIPMAEYLGLIPMSLYQFYPDTAKPKYSAIRFQAGRYSLEEKYIIGLQFTSLRFAFGKAMYKIAKRFYN